MTTAPFLDLLAMSEFIAIERGTRRCAYAHAKLFQSCPTLCDPIACQASLSLGFSRQEYWSGLPCPFPQDLPDPGIEPTSLAAPPLQVDSLLLSHGRSPQEHVGTIIGMFLVAGARVWPSCLKQKGDTNEEHRPYVQTSSGFSFLNALALLSQKVIKYYVLSYHFIIILLHQIRSDQSLSRVRLFATPWTAARQAFLSITNSRSSPRLTSIESLMPSSHLIVCCPLHHNDTIMHYMFLM